MNENNAQQWRVVRENDGENYLIAQIDMRQTAISASELRKFLPQLYETIFYTRRQLEIMEFIQRYRDSNRISPTLGEIAEELGVSKITIHEHIKKLEKKGAVTQKKYHVRSIIPSVYH